MPRHGKSKFISAIDVTSKRSTASVILIVSLAAILIILATLQYRWSGQVSEAERERMQASLLASTNQFRLQFINEFRQLGFHLQPDMMTLAQEDWKSYAANCVTALNRTDHHLIHGIYLWIAEKHGSSQLLRLNRESRTFEVSSWPPGFKPVQTRYLRYFSEPFRPSPDFRPFNWSFFFQIPLMIQPLMKFQPSPDLAGPNDTFAGCLMLHLDMDGIRRELIPELARRYFGTPNEFVYQVAVLRGQHPAEIIYKSHPGIESDSLDHPDARISLLDIPRGPFGINAPRPERSQAFPLPPFRPGPPGRGEWPPMMQNPDRGGTDLDLVAKHREGSLEAAIRHSRWRNLAISFGSLLLLAVSMGLILVFTRRAQQLAKLQIDFVAGVSHELRTPLAVICSAGDNLADGVVGSGASRKYGELIRGEGRKLTVMIEQILAFSGGLRGRRPYNLQPADMNEIVNSAIQSAEPALTDAGFSLEKKLEPGLPPIQVDAGALSQVIRNLIENALKYSPESRWIGIRTEKVQTKSGAGILLTVQDKGMGIDNEDLPHIFEPFYRGGAAASAQIHGTGLGLFMARSAITAMGGTITVKSARSKGSSFVIHLPGIKPTAGISAGVSATEKGQSEHALQNTVD